jgi:hypothetical protein
MAVALAEPAAGAPSPSEPPHGVAVYTRYPPVVDGRVDGKEWASAPPLFFPRAQGEADAVAQPPCEVRFLWTEEGVYLAFCTTETTPAFGHFKPGEPIYQEDAFEVFIDQIGDHLQYYEIQADPAGQTYFKNYVLTASPRLTPEKRLTQEFVDSELWRYDLSVPEGFQIASKLDSHTHKWSLEMFLPKSFVNRRRGSQPMESCTWRLNLARLDWDLPKDAPGRTVKFMYWAPVLPGRPHISPDAMGYLYLKKS